MNTRSYRSRACLALATAVVCMLSVVALPPSVTQAAPSDLPPRPTPQPAPGLPPRPTPRADSASQPPAGGFVELHVRFSQAARSACVRWQELWTVVQWQDAQGDWRDVEGWQGTLDEVNGDAGGKVWWVARADFGKGPFRWVVYERRGGMVLARSESFYLPHVAGEMVSVELLLVP